MLAFNCLALMRISTIGREDADKLGVASRNDDDGNRLPKTPAGESSARYILQIRNVT